MCIGPPLSQTSDCTAAPIGTPDLFQHYSVDIGAGDALCKVLETIDGALPDEFASQPNGWEAWLRPEAEKYFVLVTPHAADCSTSGQSFIDQSADAGGQLVAFDWDQALLASSSQFGTAPDRHYHVHGLLGIEPSNDGSAYDQNDPLVLTTCAAGAELGTGYQWLSRASSGLRHNGCDTTSYASKLGDFADAILANRTPLCEIAIPQPPQGQPQLDTTLIEMVYTPGGVGPAQTINQVASLAGCGGIDPHCYVEGNTLKLCPDTCALIKADPNPELELRISCPFP